MRLISLLAVCVVFLLLCVPHAHAEPQRPISEQAVDAKTKLDSAITDADKAYADAVEAARAAYGETLDKALAAAMRNADLPEAKWLKAEIESIKSGAAPATDKLQTPLAQTAQAAYVKSAKSALEARNRTLESARKQYITELQAAMKTAMTKDNDLDEATRIDEEIKRAKTMELGAFATAEDVAAAPVAAEAEQKEGTFRGLKVERRVSLTELTPRATQVGFGSFMVNQCSDNSRVLIDGRPCRTYVYAHAPSSVIYDIPEGVIGFRAIGTSPTGGVFRRDIGQWRLAVRVDDAEAFISKGIQEANGKIVVEIPLPKGAKEIELRADPMGGASHDQAIWAEPEFLMGKDEPDAPRRR